MRKALTEAQAWRAIAEKLLNEGEVHAGLCYELDVLNADNRISTDLWLSMRERLNSYRHAHEQITGQWLTYIYADGLYHEERAMVALWFALEAAEEDSA